MKMNMIRTSIISIFLLLFMSCIWVKGGFSFHYFKKYSLENKIKNHSGFLSTGDGRDTIYFNQSSIVRNISFHDSLFSNRINNAKTWVLAENQNLIPKIQSGTEEYVIAYRHFMDMCCDAFGPMTFYIIVNIKDGKPDKNKSIISVDGGQLPNSIWYMDDLKMDHDIISAKVQWDKYDSLKTTSTIFLQINKNSIFSIHQYENELNNYKYIVDKYYGWDKVKRVRAKK